MISQKNKYIYPEEINRLLKRLNKPNHNKLKEVILCIYKEGKQLKDLIPRKQVRGFEMNLKKYSEGTINFQDLRRAYKFDHPQINYRTKTKRDIMSVRLRWKILHRDNFKCVVCGADGRSSVLHVDHIKPVSLGGKTEEINLRTLCAECNMGKFNYVL